MEKPGDPVTIIDGLDDFARQLLSSNNDNPWKESKEDLSGNSFVVPMSHEFEEFGLCLGRVLGLNLKEGFVQHSRKQYFIKKHNHENSLHATYALFYLWNEGDPGHINLFNKDAKIRRSTGRLIVIPENRYHSVDPIEGENLFARFVFTSERIENRSLNKKMFDAIRSNIKFDQA